MVWISILIAYQGRGYYEHGAGADLLASQEEEWSQTWRGGKAVSQRGVFSHIRVCGSWVALGAGESTKGHLL